MAEKLLDGLGRRINYLRVSVTDRCNLRCIYCHDGMGCHIPHDSILRFEEIESLIGLFHANGVVKVRFTGGEPLVRRGFVEFLTSVRQKHPSLSLHLTTNATLLAPVLDRLLELGIGINLSLDTLSPQRFAMITGQDVMPQVMDCLERLIDKSDRPEIYQSMRPKINAVAMRGVNDGELPDFLRLVMEKPIDVRFIEFMPIGQGTAWSDKMFWPATEILDAAARLYDLVPDDQSRATSNGTSARQGKAGPARNWRLKDRSGRLSAGRFGVIASVTRASCKVCNRLRLTAEGRLRTCLYDDRDFRLRRILRHPKLGPEHAWQVIMAAIARKPLGIDLLTRREKTEVAKRQMVAIGG